MSLRLNDKKIPSFVKVNEIKMTALPPITQNTLMVLGRAGTYDFGNQIGEREIEVTVSIIADSPSDLKVKIRKFADWAYYEDAKKLVILDEADKYYLAKLTGDSPIDEIFKVGQGTIKFLCTDPHAYGHEKTFAISDVEDAPTEIVNSGSTSTYPKIKVEFTKPTTHFTIATGRDVLQFGTPVDAENQVSKNTNPLVLYDQMSSLTGWGTANTVSNGIIQGEFSSNGFSFQQKVGSDGKRDYGTGSNWHGASAVKALSRPVQDFEAQVKIGFSATTINQMGKIEIYMLDVNGVKVGKISLKDAWTGIIPQAEASAGTTQFLQTWGNKKGVFANYVGLMKLTRIGNKWTAWFGISRKGEPYHTRLTKTWIDTKKTTLAKVSQIQIHMAQLAERPVYNSMYISDTKVTEILAPVKGTEVAHIFQAGDVLEIDNETGEVLKNGIPFYEALDPTSSFIEIERGANGIIIYPENVTMDGEITITERWL